MPSTSGVHWKRERRRVMAWQRFVDSDMRKTRAKNYTITNRRAKQGAMISSRQMRDTRDMRHYYGRAMNVYEVLPGCPRLARLTDLSREAGRRLKWFDYYAHGENARLTCRHFDVSPQAL